MPSKKQRAKEMKERKHGELLDNFGKDNDTILYVNIRPDVFPKFPKWVIKTTSNNIETCIEEMKKERYPPPETLLKSFMKDGKKYIGQIDPKASFQYKYEEIKKLVNQYTEEQVLEFQKNNRGKFENWCSDVCLVYCMRVIIYELPIPINTTPPRTIE
tara:strand:+ start:126 stop:599 length:474 start_codon:yes stop_codon:yes gene_type:complete